MRSVPAEWRWQIAALPGTLLDTEDGARSFRLPGAMGEAVNCSGRSACHIYIPNLEPWLLSLLYCNDYIIDWYKYVSITVIYSLLNIK